VHAATFAVTLDAEVSAGSGFLRFGACCCSEVSLTTFGDGERNETGLASPLNVADRGVEAGEVTAMVGMRTAPDSG
jgi:hypothetical protein